MSELTPIQQYYKGKTVFITGATGFMGKVLLEKLLYSCSDLKEIIMICRTKRGKTPESRVEDMLALGMFQRIRDEKPHVLEKITVFNGDITNEFLGLSEENLKYVVDNTNIVFHMAATIKLEGHLTDLVNLNLVGTRRAIDVGRKMKNLEAFVHVSTAFCNFDQKVSYEKVYDFPHKPEDIMRMVEWVDVKTLDTITPQLLLFQPNTYTYSKRLAELYVRDQYETMPIIIARPSIVCPTAFEPIPGWMDNLDGPVGFIIGCAKGVIRSALVDDRTTPEVITADYAINGLIAIPYEFNKSAIRPAEIPVYNMTYAEQLKMSFSELISIGRRITYEYPLNIGLWYPETCATTNKYYHQLNVILFHWLPAYLIDFLMLIIGQKRFMVRVQNKVSAGTRVFQFFTLHPWSFHSENYAALWQSMTPKDKEIFYMDMDPLQTKEEYMINCSKCAKVHILKEKLEDYPRDRILIKIFYCVDRLIKTIVVGLFLYYMLKWTGVLALF